MKIGILNYNACNLASIYYAFYRMGYDPKVIENHKEIENIDRLIVPGVGAAKSCIKYMKEKKLYDSVLTHFEKKKPILGICLGLQIFSKNLYEHGKSIGFGLIDADVVSFDKYNKFNIGWCNLSINSNSFLHKNFFNKSFYFCHSYYVKIKNKEKNRYCHAIIHKNINIPAIIIKKNFMGVQFHPEKSQINGTKFMQSFLDWEPDLN